MDKKLKYGVMAAAAAGVAATGAYLCWPKRKVKSPDGTQQLEAKQFKNTIRYLSEDNYMETMHQVVEPYLKRADDIRLYCAEMTGRQSLL